MLSNVQIHFSGFIWKDPQGDQAFGYFDEGLGIIVASNADKGDHARADAGNLPTIFRVLGLEIDARSRDALHDDFHIEILRAYMGTLTFCL